MKYLNNKLIGLAMLGVTAMACTDEYNCNLQVEKPEDVAVNEYLASFDLLKSYISRGTDSPFKLTANMASTDFVAKEIAYSTILNNFDGLDIGGSFAPVTSVKEDDTYDFGGMQLVADAAQEAGVTLYGGTLCSNQEQRAAYYDELIQPEIIPIVPEKGKTVICDFENDEIGAVYTMSNGSQAVVEDDPDGKTGKTLHIGTDNDKANNSYPVFNVKLPEGRKLGDYVNLVIDMRIVNNDGIYGQGMKVFINGQEFYIGVNAQNFGCNPNIWNRGAIIKLNDSQAPGFKLPDNLKDLTEFTLAVGSHSDGAQYYLDNIIMNYEVEGGGVTTIDFEGDNVGTTYSMTNGSSSVVEEDPKGVSGKVLHVGSATSPANQSFPKFNVKLAEGRTLADYTAISLDMHLINGKGKYGQGVTVVINGQKFNSGKGPNAFGCPDNDWGRGLIYIKFVKAGETGGIVIPDELKSLTELELAVGSASGEWHAYIDNINLHWKAADIIIPVPEEEKPKIFTKELEKWIGGMIDAGGETVKAWNIVGEPLDNTINENTFDWAKYLGKEGYARTAVALARDTAKIDLDLFVSNTIEQSEDIVDKCGQLIELVKSWEADNITKIDGYNILLHANYSQDADIQKDNETAIVNLFTKLAVTGKLIRISDFSMTMVNKEGNAIPCSELSLEDRAIAGEYYTFIIKKYFELIPADKQYGISISRLTESGNSTLICPWDAKYNRTGMYVGIVDGLKN